MRLIKVQVNDTNDTNVLILSLLLMPHTVFESS